MKPMTLERDRGRCRAPTRSRYQVAAGLNGKAKAVQADGIPAKGSFLVRITTKPLPVPDPLD